MWLARTLTSKRGGTMWQKSLNEKLMCHILRLAMRVITQQPPWELLATKATPRAKRVAKVMLATIVVGQVTMQEIVG